MMIILLLSICLTLAVSVQADNSSGCEPGHEKILNLCVYKYMKQGVKSRATLLLLNFDSSKICKNVIYESVSISNQHLIQIGYVFISFFWTQCFCLQGSRGVSLRAIFPVSLSHHAGFKWLAVVDAFQLVIQLLSELLFCHKKCVDLLIWYF